jgi:hypothetical protein
LEAKEHTPKTDKLLPSRMKLAKNRELPSDAIPVIDTPDPYEEIAKTREFLSEIDGCLLTLQGQRESQKLEG